jgi:glycosyltransferase involved in cell wall biosynthesis
VVAPAFVAANDAAPTAREQPDTVLAYTAPPGVGGLGNHARHVLAALVPAYPDLRVYGPAAETENRRLTIRPTAPPTLVPDWRWRYTWFRYLTGRYRQATDSRWGQWLADELSKHPVEHAYLFTQIAREALLLARSRGIGTILDSPNGHIREFREKLCAESTRWTGWPYWGHPNDEMVARVEHEYELADHIRVSSHWAKHSLVSRGVSENKVFVVPQGIDVERFSAPERPEPIGPLRLVFVGSISLGKGFQYLLRSMARLGPHRFNLEIVGGTGDTWSRRLFDRLKDGMEVIHSCGDPLGAYQRGELFVLPTVHDGFGLVVAEAMACGLPVITTEACGAAEWIAPNESGWSVPAGDEDSLTVALDGALAQRHELAVMGKIARRTAQRFEEQTVARELQQAISQRWQ